MKLLQKMFLSVSLIALFVVVPVSGKLFAAEETTITISLPARALHEVISDALPIPLETNRQMVAGKIMIESLDKLQVKENSIFLQGVVKGENLSMNTRIAERDVSMKLGNVILPVSCELLLRFDKTGKTLFVTPRFSKTSKDGGGSELGDLLLPALTAFSDREYPVEFDSLEPLLARVGTRDIPIKLELVDIQAKQGLMVIKLKPGASKVP
ncbi:MAG: hypothetical protein ACSLFH_09970 [Desulfuromonadales bacterium]